MDENKPRFLAGYGLKHLGTVEESPRYFYDREEAEEYIDTVRERLGSDSDIYEFFITPLDNLKLFRVSFIPVNMYAEDSDDALQKYLTFYESSPKTVRVDVLDNDEDQNIIESYDYQMEEESED